MSTIRLTVTPELKEAIDYLRLVEFPTLSDSEVVKAAVGAAVVKANKGRKQTAGFDDSDPTTEEMMANTARVWGVDEDGDEEPFWDESKLKPVRL